MRRNRFSCPALAAGVSGLLCAGVLSACLNPIPDDFPNGGGRDVESEEAPDSVAPGPVGAGNNAGAPAGGQGGDEDGAGESPAFESPASDAPDAGTGPGDAGTAGGTGRDD